MLAAFDSGRYRIETKPDAVRAMAATALMKFAWALYNAHWTVIRNDTGTGFLTSDNPVAFNDPGPWRGGQPGLPRYLTLSPHLCLYVKLTMPASAVQTYSSVRSTPVTRQPRS
jgi:hypothetical protein